MTSTSVRRGSGLGVELHVRAELDDFGLAPTLGDFITFNQGLLDLLSVVGPIADNAPTPQVGFEQNRWQAARAGIARLSMASPYDILIVGSGLIGMATGLVRVAERYSTYSLQKNVKGAAADALREQIRLNNIDADQLGHYLGFKGLDAAYETLAQIKEVRSTDEQGEEESFSSL